MSPKLEKTLELFQEAKKYIPFGVNSNFRYWGDEYTLVVTRGQGPYIWDADENRYIDYRLGFGPIILGHAYPTVIERVTKEIQNGTLFAWTTPLEIELAKRITRMTGVEKVRLTNTGTEATMHALRIARAYTDREGFIKFEGQYHGMHDYVLFSTASAPRGVLGARKSPINVQASSGIPEDIQQYVYNVPYNDFKMLEKTVKESWSDLAAIIVEPILGNAGAVMPKPGWLELIRELCDKYDIVLIFDEVKTGFRIANGGAQEYFGVKADLVTYAKALGNGFPIAAIGGKEEVMSVVQPGQVALGGTYSGNVVGAAAANATLEMLETQPVLETIAARGKRLMQGIDEILTRAGIPHVLTGVPAMFGVLLGRDTIPYDFRDYQDADEVAYQYLVMELIERGVLPDVDDREPWFLSYSHDDAVIDETLNALEDAVKALTKKRPYIVEGHFLIE